MTDKQKYQRRQINHKIFEAMHHCEHLERQADALHKRYFDVLATIDEERKKIRLLEDKQEKFYRKVFKRR